MSQQTDADLLAQIAHYAGAINRHQQTMRAPSGPYAVLGERPRSLDRYVKNKAHRAGSTRNRSLVVNRRTGASEMVPAQSAWISSRDNGHMTLTSSVVYDASLASKIARSEDIRSAKRKAKLIAKEAREAERLKYLSLTTIEHEGIKYRLNKRANLLIRISLDDVLTNKTPLETTINGVAFMKSPKSENLYRKTTVRLHSKRLNQDQNQSASKHCKYFTRTGTCKNAKTCRYQHSADHVAICPFFLTSRGCSDGAGCNLSHAPSPCNTPACSHFLRGACTKEDSFGRLGYCSKGADCLRRHVRECPSFSNTGQCIAKGCRLPHVARASAQRKNAAEKRVEREQAASDSSEESDDSTDDYEEEDFDSDAFGDFVKL